MWTLKFKPQPTVCVFHCRHLSGPLRKQKLTSAGSKGLSVVIGRFWSILFSFFCVSRFVGCWFVGCWQSSVFLDISTSRHLDISTSRHLDISTSRHLDISTSRHHDISTSRHLHISTSPHLDISTSWQVDKLHVPYGAPYILIEVAWNTFVARGKKNNRKSHSAVTRRPRKAHSVE